MAINTNLQVTPLDNVGVEISGFNINEPAGPEVHAELNRLWLEHGILVFRDQDITPENQIEFSRIFGELEIHPLKATTSEEYPELFVLENGVESDKPNTAFYDGEAIVNRLAWHMDLHYTGKPNRGALLRAVIVADEDGLTGFGDLTKAYETLDDATKAKISNIEVAYKFEMQRTKWRFIDNTGYAPGPHSPKTTAEIGFPDFPDSIYPAVVTHPVSAKPVLEVVEQFLDRVIDPEKAGMSNDEADDLLRQLVAHTRKPEFHYWHQWRAGDMVLWDNWSVMHCTTGTKPGVRRLIHRTTIAGGQTLGRQ